METKTMEATSHSLAIESLSHSWLSNRKYSLEALNLEPLRPSLDIFNESTSEETKYKMTITQKTFLQNSQNSNFDFPISKSFPSLVHADEIFSHGHLLPMYNQSNPAPSKSASSISLRTVCPDRIIHFHLLRKWQKSSKRILKKYFGFLGPFSRKVGFFGLFSRKVWEVRSWENSPQASPLPPPPPPPPPQGSSFCVDIDRGVWKARSWSNSPLSSPPQSPPCYSGDWGVDSSIYEAILHCKRSFASHLDLIPGSTCDIVAYAGVLKFFMETLIQVSNSLKS
ncbi:hypothetical protein TEA_028357 [Camellia sinensis var. sinensis]|uniref:Uncharacterized protein n=1 Tax=Camellia sinensis var. sinensis TaxID=542762 RepID=A0A4S4F1C2_CAMSN|nr:hypothetical protein TEA_028357 [Camellia sinensis var. sinensis]